MECKFVLRVYTPHLPLSELIDTLWNVNEQHQIRNEWQWRINRYIMECKYIRRIAFTLNTVELIDTLWNVNLEPSTAKFGSPSN